MFWIILIIGAFAYIKFNSDKKSNDFKKLLQNLHNVENVDTTTLNAIITAHNLMDSNAPFNTVLNYTLNIFKNKKDNFNNSSNDIDIEQDLVGQISLLEPDPIEQNSTYMPPTTQVNPYSQPPIFQPAHIPNIKNFQAPKIKPIKTLDLDASLIVLILGVILVQVSAIIFSTTIWNSVDSFAKIGILVVLSLINFAVSKVFYTRFETKSPSSAFYILGYSFLSFSVICAGYFFIPTGISKIFVDVNWLFTLVFFSLLICYFSYLGYKVFNKNPFLWVALFSTDLIIFFLSKAVFNSGDIIFLILSLYAVFFVYLINTGKFKLSNNVLLDFSKINLILISFVAMTGSVTVTLNNTISILLVLMTCCVLSGGFLLSNKNQFNNDTSSICFCLIMVIGLFRVGFDSSLNTAFLMLCFLPLTIFVFKLMNILDEELQQRLNFVTLIFSFFVFFFNSIYSFNMADPSIISLITLIILFISVTALNKSSGLEDYQYVHPILLTVIVIELRRLLEFYNIFTQSGLSFVIATLLFGIFLFYTFVPKWKINTFISQNIFPITLAFTSLNTEYRATWDTLDFTFMLYYIVLVIICYAINTIYEKNKSIQYVYATLSVLPSLMLITPLYRLISNPNINRIDVISLLIFFIAIMIYYLNRFVISKKFLPPINIIYGMTSLYCISVEFIFNHSSNNFDNTTLFLFISTIALYVTQRIIKEDNFILNRIIPFILVIEGSIIVNYYTQSELNLYFYTLIGLVAIAGVLLKPNSYFRLPFNTIMFIKILGLRLFYEDNFNYFLLIATILCFASELYKAYLADSINHKNNKYIFILTSLLFMISPNISISQLFISVVAIVTMYLISKLPNILHLNSCLNLFNFYLTFTLFIQAFDITYTSNDNILLSSIISILSLSVIMLIGNSSKTKSNFIFGLGSFFLYLIMMENIDDLLHYNIPNISRELRLTLTIFTINLALYFSKYLNLEEFSLVAPKSVIVKETVKFNIFKFSVTLPISRIDFSSFLGIIGIIKLLDYGYASQAFILLSLFFLNFTRRSIDELFTESNFPSTLFSDITLLSCSVGSLALALLSQDFITIPKLYRTEYEVLVCIGFIIALRYLWKEKMHPTTYFVTMVCTIVRLFLDVMSYKLVFDAILLGVGIIGLLLYGLHLKHRRVVILSVGSVLLLITYISFAFWNNSYWFAYLVLTGILLIGISVYIENKKRKDRIENKVD